MLITALALTPTVPNPNTKPNPSAAKMDPEIAPRSAPPRSVDCMRPAAAVACLHGVACSVNR